MRSLIVLIVLCQCFTAQAKSIPKKPLVISQADRIATIRHMQRLAKHQQAEVTAAKADRDTALLGLSNAKQDQIVQQKKFDSDTATMAKQAKELHGYALENLIVSLICFGLVFWLAFKSIPSFSGIPMFGQYALAVKLILCGVLAGGAYALVSNIHNML